jgi:hypothetical protein
MIVVHQVSSAAHDYSTLLLTVSGQFTLHDNLNLARRKLLRIFPNGLFSASLLDLYHLRRT